MAEDTSKTPTTKGMGKEIGQSGTAIYKGIITLEEYNSKMKGKQGLRMMEIMRRSDATVRATLQVCKLPILQTKWFIKPASEDEEDQKQARHIERELFKRNVSWHDFLREGMTFFDFGHSVAEKTLELVDFEGEQLIGIKKLAYRKQTTIQQWEMDDGQPGIKQLLQSGQPANIPMAKLIIFTNDKEGDNYEGVSLLRYAYKHWDIKDKLDRVNAVALEKQGVGVPILKKPADADQADLDKAREQMRQFRANEEGYQEIPIGWEIEMMDMKGGTTKEIIPSIQYHDRQITMSVLAQFLTLGASDASGSRAVSSDHSKLFMLSEEAVAKNIQTTIQDQLINPLCDLNFSNMPNGAPTLEFARISDEDVNTVADAVQKFMSAGVLTYDPESEEYIRGILHLPEMPEDLKKRKIEEMKNPPQPPVMNPDGTPKDDNADDDQVDDLPEEDEGTPEEKEKAKKELKKKEAIRAAQLARKNLIDTLVS